jgi:hypothetical protein
MIICPIDGNHRAHHNSISDDLNKGCDVMLKEDILVRNAIQPYPFEI